jgi:mRNA-degrading endonuclease RelE of RelBE toxin-antitoxin system
MKIELHKSVQKYIRRLQPKEQRRVLLSIYRLPSGDVKPLTGRPGEYRLRVGDWWIIYEYRDDVLFVMEMDSRGGIY